MNWRRRLTILAQRLWQPTSACMACMSGGLEKIVDPPHWRIALETGMSTGVLALLLTFTSLAFLYGKRGWNALLVGFFTALGDAFTHYRTGSVSPTEVLATGAVSGAFAWATSFCLEDRARRLRQAWRAVFG